MKRVAIIGAGISGLLCARQLNSVMDVWVYEKSRIISGRMATRRVPETGANFDHGAQYFTVRSNEVRPLLEDWLDDRVVAPWQGSVVTLKPGLKIDRDPTPRFVPLPEMNSLAKYLALPLSVRAETPISKVERSSDGWTVITDDQQPFGPFDWLVCASTPSVALSLLGDSHPFHDQVSQQKFDSCWATMVHFASPFQVPFDGAFVHENPLRWICRNNSKPGRDVNHECWVLHATPEWSNKRSDLPAEEVAAQSLEALADATGTPLPAVRFVDSRRWQQSAPIDPLSETCLVDPSWKLAICGDWCNQARVEGAMLSGLGVAERILAEEG
ncbi:NAD(P)/FAD-dependent oxidoreductase [Blastopirellula marina]|uniref:Amine oxidase domain-containing protein n=1 Tax=Blastopirellula marina TaxID=124 RepID=A0A2S8GJF5_9BACT|nr:FAD-dependent oxidoreductase [Blastopirellula marina]PQO44582.1 hypothetical protein C5Y93_19480 [Blastopirellula marina]